ncbi:YqzL family protein [Gordoniibacillus kamchatkensis]|nr:YqzL family protein [Paenibacillus sp. VKM B-2647]
MRDFSWKVFTMTGDVDAYLLYKQASGGQQGEPDADAQDGEEDDTDLINF